MIWAEFGGCRVKAVGQGSSNLALEGHCPAQFSTNSDQTPTESNQGVRLNQL